MEAFVILICVFLLAIITLIVKYKIEEYIEDKRFMKRIDKMLKRRNEEISRRLIEGLEKSTPFMIKYIKEQIIKNENERTTKN